MSALSAARNTLEYGTDAVVKQTQFGVAATKKIYPGAIVVSNTSGYVQPATAANNLICLGRANPRTSLAVDNTSGSNGDLTCLVDAGTFWFANSATTDAITIADRGKWCYLVDDQTVAKTSGSGARSAAGIVVDVDATNGVAVQMGLANTLSDPATSNTIADPGTATAIPVTASGYIALTVGAGAETNTLAVPTFTTQRLVICLDTVAGGSRAITCAQAINQAGNTIMTFAAARDVIELVGITVGGALRWQVGLNDGVALS